MRTDSIGQQRKSLDLKLRPNLLAVKVHPEATLRLNCNSSRYLKKARINLKSQLPNTKINNSFKVLSNTIAKDLLPQRLLKQLKEDLLCLECLMNLRLRRWALKSVIIHLTGIKKIKLWWTSLILSTVLWSQMTELYLIYACALTRIKLK